MVGKAWMNARKHKTCGITRAKDMYVGRIDMKQVKKMRDQIIKDLMP